MLGTVKQNDGKFNFDIKQVRSEKGEESRCKVKKSLLFA